MSRGKMVFSPSPLFLRRRIHVKMDLRLFWQLVVMQHLTETLFTDLYSMNQHSSDTHWWSVVRILV